MPVKTLSIDRFRNLTPVTLDCSARLNLFIGANAAGKTSLLEALYILGRARSFRTRDLDKAIQTGSDHFQVVARVHPNGGRVIPVGISRAEKQLKARIDSQTVKRLSDLAALFPLQWVGGNLHRLLEEGPAFRRQFLDWGLFHVKHNYNLSWKRFHKVLKQRNASLRNAGSEAEIAAWDGELANQGTVLHEFRQQYIQAVETVFQRITAELLDFSMPFEIRYRQGWPTEHAYAEVLKAGIGRDREQGYTRAGPQRADLAFYCGGQAVTELLSRGQQKLLVVALHVAQAMVLKQSTGLSSLFLLDDLGAELDGVNQTKIMNLLVDIDAQVFATAIDLPDMSGWQKAETKTFHVKHGRVTEVL